MDVKIEIITGGGKKANRESKSVTIKEVSTKEQVLEVLDSKFKDYFPSYRTLDKPQGKKAKTAE